MDVTAESPEITAVDRGVLELKNAVANLDSQIANIQSKIDGSVSAPLFFFPSSFIISPFPPCIPCLALQPCYYRPHPVVPFTPCQIAYGSLADRFSLVYTGPRPLCTDRCMEKATAALRQKRKELALSYIRSRKQLEDLLKRRLGSLETLHATLIRVEAAAGDIEVRCYISLPPLHIFSPRPPSSFTEYNYS